MVSGSDVVVSFAFVASKRGQAPVAPGLARGNFVFGHGGAARGDDFGDRSLAPAAHGGLEFGDALEQGRKTGGEGADATGVIHIQGLERPHQRPAQAKAVGDRRVHVARAGVAILDQAERLSRVALTIDDRDPLRPNIISWSLASRGRFEEAARLFEQVASTDSDAMAATDLGVRAARLYMALGAWRPAVDSWALVLPPPPRADPRDRRLGGGGVRPLGARRRRMALG